MKYTITLGLLLCAGLTFAQDAATAPKAKNDVAVKYAQTITEKDLSEDLHILASDALEGRETGKRGQKMAAAFIKASFEELGLVGPVKNGRGNGYYQDVPLVASKAGNTYLKIKDQKYKNIEDGLLYLGSGNTTQEHSAKVIFAGNGSKDAFDNLEVKDQAVLVIVDGRNRAARSEAKAQAQAHGAKILFTVMHDSDDKFKEFTKKYSHYFTDEKLGLDKGEKDNASDLETFYVSPSVAGKIMNQSFDKLTKAANAFGKGKKSALKKMKSNQITYQLESIRKKVISENVLGYLEGSDLKDELIVITAHYDHVGMHDGKVYNGADDDGSGTVGLIELAEAFTKAKADGKGPRRSILFMTVTGEEKGLLGSAYYADHSIFPLENTVVNLNIDMIGRTGDRDFETEDYVFLVGADKISSELHQISEDANATYTKMYLDYTYNDEKHPDRIYYRSDHWNFAKKGVPIIFYFNGTHEDYHKHTDTVDKINWPMLEKRTQLVFYTAWEIANRDARLKIDKK